MKFEALITVCSHASSLEKLLVIFSPRRRFVVLANVIFLLC